MSTRHRCAHLSAKPGREQQNNSQQTNKMSHETINVIPPKLGNWGYKTGTNTALQRILTPVHFSGTSDNGTGCASDWWTCSSSHQVPSSACHVSQMKTKWPVEWYVKELETDIPEWDDNVDPPAGLTQSEKRHRRRRLHRGNQNHLVASTPARPALQQ